MKNKCILILDHSKGIGGGQKSILALLKSLDNVSCDMQFIFLINKSNKLLIDYLNDAKATFFTVNYNANIVYRFFLIFSSFLKIRKARRFDVIYGNTFEGGFWGAVLGIIFNLKLIFRARLGIDVFNHGIVDWIIYKRSSVILANSEYVLESFVSRFGDKAISKIVVVYNPITNIEGFNFGDVNEYEVKSIVNIGLIGKIERIKNQLDAIKAIEYLIDKTPSTFNLYLIGAIDEKDNGNYHKEINEYIKDKNVKKYIYFEGFKETPKEIFSPIDIVINCTVGEALSRVMYESQLIGIPNIATKSGGNTELITNGVTGLLYAPGDYQELAQKIILLSSDKTLYRKISQNAHNNVLNLFSIDCTVLKELNLVSKCLN